MATQAIPTAAVVGGLNPLAMLAGPVAGMAGLGAPQNAYSSANQDVQLNTPFNVGSGSQRSDAVSGAGGLDFGALMPIAILGIVAWAVVNLMK